MRHTFNGLTDRSSKFVWGALLSVPFFLCPSQVYAGGSGWHSPCETNEIILPVDEHLVIETDVKDETAIAIDGTPCQDDIRIYGDITLSGTYEGQLSSGEAESAAFKKYHKHKFPLNLIGVDAEKGDDGVVNNGQIEVIGTTMLEDEPGSAVVSTLGIAGNRGDDSLVNYGTLNVQSDASVMTSDIELELIDSGDFSSQAIAAATGIKGDSGSDDIRNSGPITVNADAEVKTGAYSISLAGGTSEVSAGNSAKAFSIGIDAGDGDNTLLNGDVILSTAAADVSGVNAELNLIDTTHGDTSTNADSKATGVIAGDGDDWINNSGSISAIANSTSTAVSVEINAIDAATANGTTNLNSSAAGLDLGSGDDLFTGSGAITADSLSELLEVGVNASFVDVTIADREAGELSTSLNANSLGLDGGKGDDIIHLSSPGTLDATAKADVYSLGVSLASEGVPASTEPLILEQSLASLGISAVSNSLGIDSGRGDDELTSLSDITVAATSGARQDSINVGIALIDFKIPTPGIVIGSAGTQADATAGGLIAGDGSDAVLNSGLLDIDADATASATTVSINFAEFSADFFPDTSIPVLSDLGASLVAADTITQADATTLGIDGGEGDDRIFNTGSAFVDANAHSGSTSASASLNIKYEEGDNFLALDALFARAITEANSTATGITGGDGDDLITNTGDLTTDSEADTNSVSVAVDVAGTLQGNGGAIALAATDTSNTAEAVSTGIDAGDGDDKIENIGDLTAISKAEVDSVNVSTTIGITEKGLVAGVALARAENTADADAVGIDAGEGSDSILNDGSLTANATALADAVAVTATIEGTTRGLAVDAALIDASTSATASAVGILSDDESDEYCKQEKKQDYKGSYSKDGKGHDHKDKESSLIVNTGTLSVDADANTDSVAVDASIGLAEKGVAIGAALADVSATSAATAKGIVTGDNDDVVINDGSILLSGTGDADAISVALTIEGTATGVAGGAALTDSSVDASSYVSGIESGTGEDFLINNGTIRSEAVNTTSTAVGISPSVFIANQGVALGVALADTSATARTEFNGIDSGKDDDQVANIGDIDLQNIDAHADAVAVSLALAGGSEGVAVTGAAADGDTTAINVTQAIDGGKGDDNILNQGEMTLGQIGADATAVSVSLGVTGESAGVAINGALVDADATADTTVSVLNGDDGDDSITNENLITLDGVDSETDAVGVGVSFSFAGEGLSVGAALAETGTRSFTNVGVLDGDGGNDWLSNYGDISLKNVTAEADAVTVSVGLAGSETGVAVGAGLADASGLAEVNATVFSGGEGDDVLLNDGGGGDGGDDGEVLLLSVGGGEGITVENINADAQAVGVSVALSGAEAGVAAGFTLTDTSATARTNVMGMSGDGGDDNIINNASIALRQIEADSDAVTASITANAVIAGGVAGGAAFSDASATAESSTAAIDGGSGDDRIINHSDVTLEDIKSNVDATGVSVQIGISNAGLALGGAVVDTSTTANTDVMALAGGKGNDVVKNEGSLWIDNIIAEADAVSVGVTLNGALEGGVAAGISMTDGAGNANLTVIGIDGGDGKDKLINSASIHADNIEANAHAAGVSVSVQAAYAGVVVGAALADTSADAVTDIKGMAGGTGDDALINTEDAAIDISGKSVADALSLSVSVGGTIGLGGGIEVTDASTTAETTVMGIDGGAGRDDILNKGSITANAESRTESDAISAGVTVAVGGDATFADARSTATATAVGISGGESETDWDWRKKPHDKKHYGKKKSDDKHKEGDKHDSDKRYVSSNAEHSGKHEKDNDEVHHDRKNDHKKKEDPESVIINSGKVTAIAVANSEGTGIAGNLLGFAMGETTNTSIADATAILGNDSKDTILNSGELVANSDANAYGLAVAANFGGAAMSESTTTATSIATGLDSSGGDDTVYNNAAVTSYAQASAEGISVSAGFIGYFSGDASSTATAAANGLDGGEGNDKLVNKASITINSSSIGDSFSGAGVFTGVAAAEATGTANAVSRGMTGGDGNDWVSNLGTMTVSAGDDSVAHTFAGCERASGGACVRTSSFSLSLIGGSLTNAASLADSNATGLDGGIGSDILKNAGPLGVTALARGRSSGTSVNLAGVANADASSTTHALATAIGGGLDADLLLNEAQISVDAATENVSNSVSVSVAGSVSSNADTIASANAFGLNGGEGDDSIHNSESAVIGVNSTSSSSANSSSWVFAGASGAEAQLLATTQSTGIAGDAGDDCIQNDGTVDVDTGARLTTTGGGRAIFGRAKKGSSISADSHATGIDGGSGDDFIKNTSTIDVNSNANMLANTISVAFIGGASTDELINARSSASGLVTGEGAFTIDNSGAVNIGTTAKARSQGSAKADLGGNTDVSGRVAARVSAVGVDGSLAGDGVLNNSGTIDVSALMRPWATHDSSAGVFFSDGGAVAEVRGSASSRGIALGDGDHAVANSGEINVTASTGTDTYGGTVEGVFARVDAEGGDFDFFTGNGDASARADARASLSEIGIGVGSGINDISNIGSIDINTGGFRVNAVGDPNAGTVTVDGDGEGRATAGVSASAYGIVTGDGIQNNISNEGSIALNINPYALSNLDADAGLFGDADARATSWANNNRVAGMQSGLGDDVLYNVGGILVTSNPYANAISDANGNGIDGNGDGNATATTISNAYGIDAAAGNNLIVNEGTIEVNAYSRAVTSLKVESEGSARSNARESKTSEQLNAKGIVAADGDNRIEQSGTLSVLARSINSSASSNSNAGGIGAPGNGTSNGIIVANAYGLDIGNGANEVINFDSMTVSARADASASASADGDLSGDGTATSTATSTVRAYGINAGDGANHIWNKGLIDVSATSNAAASSSASSDGIDGDATANATGNADARAYGILTGNGNNYVENTGTIKVRANSSASTSTSASVSSITVCVPFTDICHTEYLGDRNRNASRNIVSRAYGIYTGSGNDHIFNKGVIDVAASGGDTGAIGIYSGAGDDVVELSSESSVSGGINLGADNDTLRIHGEPVVTGTITGGTETDTAIFDGTGTFSNPLLDFENIIKEGEGAFSVAHLDPTKSISLENGVLKVEDAYEFDQQGELNVSISHSEEGYMEVESEVGLAGAINVERGSGHHVNGDVRLVILAQGGFDPNSAFNGIHLPDPTPLLQFIYVQNADSFNIETKVNSFTTVAGNDNQRALAGYLDSTLAYASGDVSVLLGDIQAMQAGEHDNAYTNLSPESYGKFNQVATAVSQQYIDSIQSRLSSVRFSEISGGNRTRSGFGNAYKRLYNGSNENDYLTGVWLKTFSQNGERNQQLGDSHYDFSTRGFTLGYDTRVSDNIILGISVGSASNSSGDLTNLSRGNVESDQVSVYGSYTGKRAWFDTVMTYGKNEYFTQRDVAIADLNNALESTHDSNLLSTAMSSGYYFKLDDHNWLEPFASLQYMSLQEEGFRETGGTTALDIHSKTTDTLLSFVGTRYQYFSNRGSGRFNTELSLSWLHDYGIDERSITASFAGDALSSFSVNTQALDDNGILFAAGIGYEGHRGFITSLRYVHEDRGDYRASGIMGELLFNF